MGMIEGIFVSDSTSNITVFDLRRGTILMHYKCGTIGTCCLNLVNNDYILAAEKGPLITVWPINSQEKLHNLRLMCPGTIGCCIVSPNGLYVAVSIKEKLLVWQLSSGKLLSTSSSHYQSITVVKWSPDGSILATGGEDGLVCVCRLSHLFEAYKSHEIGSSSRSATYFTFSHHSVKITDLFISNGGLRSRLFTTSADKTCKIYDLATGSLLLSVVFDFRPTCISVDVPEIIVYIGFSDGIIRTFSLRDPPRTPELHFSDSDSSIQFVGHNKSVTCLTLSVDETILISGSSDEFVKLWHISSKQCIRSIRLKGSVSNIIVRTIPDSLQSYDLCPTTIIKSFQKNYDDSQDTQPLEIICSSDNYSREQIVTEQSEISQLTQRIVELTQANQALFNFAKDKLLEKSSLVSQKDTNRVPVVVSQNEITVIKKKKRKLIKQKRK